MADVAKLAQVSHQTVSRVLNSHPSVRPVTRERVLAAMAELDYRPNRLARALVTSRSGQIGVLTSGSAKFGPMSALMAVEEAARRAGYAVNVATVRESELEGEESSHGIHQVLNAFDQQAVEAVVVIAPRVSAVALLADIGSRAPLLLVASGVEPTDRFDVVSVDQVLGARLVTRHLIDQGNRVIGHLAGPSDWFDARQRRVGWESELAAAGLPLGPVWEGDWSADAGFARGQELVASGDLPDAIVAANDQMALGLLRAFGEAGIEVPGRVSVTGFDDIEGTAHFQPPLTTVHQDFDALGEAVMRALARQIGPAGVRDDAGNDRTPPIAPELVVRSSTRAR